MRCGHLVKGWETREELWFMSKDGKLTEFLLFQGMSVFVILRPLTDCMCFTNIM